MGGVYNLVNLHVYHYAGNNPVKYVDPDGRTTRGLTEDEWTNVKDVIDFAVANLDTLIMELTRYLYGNTQSLPDEITRTARDYLGIDLSSKNSSHIFQQDLIKIRNGFKSLTIDNFEYNSNLFNSTGSRAAVNPSAEHIKLDPMFFSIDNYIGFGTKLGDLMHEVTHFNTVLRTIDYTNGYGLGAVQNLVRNSPSEAYRNADNWGFFLEQYVRRMNER